MEKPLDYVALLAISVVLIVGAYQFYFFCQRNMLRAPISLETRMDSWIGYRPGWVWIYSGLYYPVILLVIASIHDTRQYIYTALSYLLLLIFQMAVFLLFPVAIPPSWRGHAGGDGLSERFLRLVQRFDATSNCFPSMHVSVAMLTALHLQTNRPELFLWPLLFPVLIAASALYTKQHFVVDVPPGAALGWLTFFLYKAVYP